MRYLEIVYGKNNKQKAWPSRLQATNPRDFLLLGQAKGQGLQIILAMKRIQY